jgi:hypothetical protein
MKGVHMGNRIIIEENTIYEIDEECIKKMEKQKIAIEIKNKNINDKNNQVNKFRKI